MTKKPDAVAVIETENGPVFHPVWWADPISARKLTVAMDKVQKRKVEWLWRDRIPLRAVTLLAGVGGLGKSQTALAIAGELSRGELTSEPESTLLLTAEDDLEVVVKGRLEACKADASFIHALRQEVDIRLPDDFEKLRDLAKELDVRMIVIDPLSAYVGSDTDTHKESDVRALVGRLYDIASVLDLAVVCVVHFKKGTEQSALYRVSGSAGYGNAARSVIAAARDPNDETQRVLMHVKSNYGAECPALRYHIESYEDSSLVVFDREDGGLSEQDVFGDQRPGPKPEREQEAEEFLMAALSGEHRFMKEVMDEAAAAGISAATLRRAKKSLRVQAESIRNDLGQVEGWLWSLGDLDSKDSDI